MASEPLYFVAANGCGARRVEASRVRLPAAGEALVVAARREAASVRLATRGDARNACVSISNVDTDESVRDYS